MNKLIIATALLLSSSTVLARDTECVTANISWTVKDQRVIATNNDTGAVNISVVVIQSDLTTKAVRENRYSNEVVTYIGEVAGGEPLVIVIDNGETTLQKRCE